MAASIAWLDGEKSTVEFHVLHVVFYDGSSGFFKTMDRGQAEKMAAAFELMPHVERVGRAFSE